VLENGRPVDIRRVVPAADGGPVRAVFTVSPPRDTATLYTVEIPSAAGERVLENNKRTVLVEPPGRRRRILMIEGAPGFEHSFIRRALAGDPGLEVDSVVRKGRDARGAATYFVQATEARAPRLAGGFPQERAALYEYDALVLANVESDALSRPQLQMIADFVDVRGGGVLVLGAKSFVQQGFAGTPLEDVLPLHLTDRGSGVVRVSARANARYSVTLTPDGQSHPVMRIVAGSENMTARWAEVPPLSGAAALGALRPGAQALALVQAPDGPRPLVAVQRYGQGRSMVFTGEASWRWRMQMPSEDRTYELFWRQAARWMTAGAPEHVSIVSPQALVPGSAAAIGVDVRNDVFAPVRRRRHTARPCLGQRRHATPIIRSRRYAADLRLTSPNLSRTASARSGAVSEGAERSLLVGGADFERPIPRLNECPARCDRQRRQSPAEQAGQLSTLLAFIVPEPSVPQLQEPGTTSDLSGVMVLLAVEWTLPPLGSPMMAETSTPNHQAQPRNAQAAGMAY
jgi:uncharacterized membrane protein